MPPDLSEELAAAQANLSKATHEYDQATKRFRECRAYSYKVAVDRATTELLEASAKVGFVRDMIRRQRS